MTYSSLSAVIDHVQESAWPADMLALTGDLIQDDSRAAYEHLIPLLAPLRLPILAIPGNHDIRALMQSTLPAKEFGYCASMEFGNWLIIGLDSCVKDSAGGHVVADELERLAATAAASAAEHVLVCLHHPPVPVGSRWLDSVGLDNADELLDAMSGSGKVRAAIFGHVHQDVSAQHGAIDIIGTPSTCRQFKPGSDEFEVDDRPPAYRRIELHADGSLTSELQWVEP